MHTHLARLQIMLFDELHKLWNLTSQSILWATQSTHVLLCAAYVVFQDFYRLFTCSFGPFCIPLTTFSKINVLPTGPWAARNWTPKVCSWEQFHDCQQVSYFCIIGHVRRLFSQPDVIDVSFLVGFAECGVFRTTKFKHDFGIRPSGFPSFRRLNLIHAFGCPLDFCSEVRMIQACTS